MEAQFPFSGYFRLMIISGMNVEVGKKIPFSRCPCICHLGTYHMQCKFSRLVFIEAGIFRGRKSRHLRTLEQVLENNQFSTWNWVAVAVVWAQAKNRYLQETKTAAIW